MNEFGDFPLWRFSLDFYGRDRAAAVLLELQDTAGADVNLVLFGLWRAIDRRVLSLSEYQAVDMHVREWRDNLVLPARALRRGIKDLVNDKNSSVYREAKALELKLEQAQQWRLQNCVDMVPGSFSDGVKETALKNLAVYAALLSTTFTEGAAWFLAELTEAMPR